MKKNKKGFTLAEVLVCMTIIGVIMAFSVNAIRIVKASYTALTYFSHRNLQNIIGTLYSGDTLYTESHKETKNYTEDGESKSKEVVIAPAVKQEGLMDVGGNRIPSAVTFGKTPNGDIVSVLKNDYEFETTQGIAPCTGRPATDYEGNDRNNRSIFCHAFSAITNTTGITSTNNGTKSTVHYRCNLNDLFEAKYNSADAQPYIENLSPNLNKPNLITTNGQRYYISKWKYDPGNVSDIYGYRLIAVDLNGKSGPNKVNPKDPKVDTGSVVTYNPPDIVTFMVMDNGEVLPLGVAADNIVFTHKRVQYITANVLGYYFDRSYEDSRSEVSIPEECKKSRIDVTTQETIPNQCNFARIQIENPYGTNSEDGPKSFFTYREAYCATHDTDDRAYPGYCSQGGTTFEKYELCPPSTGEQRFDSCKISTVKPMFRYNLK